jgi:hypothetical protein
MLAFEMQLVDDGLARVIGRGAIELAIKSSFEVRGILLFEKQHQPLPST